VTWISVEGAVRGWGVITRSTKDLFDSFEKKVPCLSKFVRALPLATLVPIQRMLPFLGRRVIAQDLGTASKAHRFFRKGLSQSNGVYDPGTHLYQPT